MDIILAIIAWLTLNFDQLIIGVVALHGVALVIVNLTPTPRDDLFVARFYKIVEVIAGIFGSTAKEFAGERATIRDIQADAAGLFDNDPYQTPYDPEFADVTLLGTEPVARE